MACCSRRVAAAGAGLLAAGLIGCGTTRSTDTQRAGNEMLLVSHAIDQAVNGLDFSPLKDQPVFLDVQYLDNTIDKGYLISSVRQHLAAYGGLLMEKREEATFVVELRSGGVGTDRYDLLIGVPQMNLPAIVPGQPSSIPEIPFAKRTDQHGVAKIAVFIYNRKSGRALWQSGVVQGGSKAKDTWVLGAGPFRRGSIVEGTAMPAAGLNLSDLTFSGEDPAQPQTKISVTSAAVFGESQPQTPGETPGGTLPAPGSEIRQAGQSSIAPAEGQGNVQPAVNRERE